MKTVAYVYSCRNPGQVALRWEWSTPPIGHGWLDVKRDPLVRLSDVEALLRAAYMKGFEESGEGWNAEYPSGVIEKQSFIDGMNTVVQELLK